MICCVGLWSDDWTLLCSVEALFLPRCSAERPHQQWRQERCQLRLKRRRGMRGRRRKTISLPHPLLAISRSWPGSRRCRPPRELWGERIVWGRRWRQGEFRGRGNTSTRYSLQSSASCIQAQLILCKIRQKLWKPFLPGARGEEGSHWQQSWSWPCGGGAGERGRHLGHPGRYLSYTTANTNKNKLSVMIGKWIKTSCLSQYDNQYNCEDDF